jgi:hypothetical protein
MNTTADLDELGRAIGLPYDIARVHWHSPSPGSSPPNWWQRDLMRLAICKCVPSRVLRIRSDSRLVFVAPEAAGRYEVRHVHRPGAVSPSRHWENARHAGWPSVVCYLLFLLAWLWSRTLDSHDAADEQIDLTEAGRMAQVMTREQLLGSFATYG